MAIEFDIQKRHEPATPLDFKVIEDANKFVSSYRGMDFNVFDIHNLVFSYRALPFPQGDAKKIFGINTDRFSKLGTALFGKSSTGQEVFCPITIIDGEKEYDLPFSVVGMDFPNKTEETQLTGRRGEVIEFISQGGIEFFVRGVIVDRSRPIPEEGLEMLNELRNKAHAVRIKNAVTDFFMGESDSVVIKRVRTPDMKGVSHAQAYEITLKQDFNLELEVK